AWAAAFVADDGTVVTALRDADPGVRLEGIRSLARMKGQVTGVAEALLGCMCDAQVAVRREALRQAVRWAPPAEWQQRYAETLADGLASGDRDVRRLAAEAMAAQAPEALARLVSRPCARCMAREASRLWSADSRRSNRRRGWRRWKRC